jgi:hypothetical protein
MKDFLDSLIARHFDATPQIKPRLPSIFESPVFADSLGNDTEEEMREIDESIPPTQRDSLVERSSPDVELTKPSFSPQVSHRINDTESFESARPSVVPHGANRREALLSDEHGNETHSSRSPSKIESNNMERPLSEKSAMKGEMQPVAAAFSRSQLSGKAETNGSFRSLKESSEAIRSLLPRLMSESEQGLDVRDNQEPVAQQEGRQQTEVRSDVDSKIRPVTLPSAILVAPPVSSLVAREQPTFQREPIINVTIGRIEVRATMSAPKRVVKRDSKTPVMGLEEYLRRRSEGRDR